MKKPFLIVALVFCCSALFAQKVDSIYFHLYTDSLKKGTHNYINVDGKTHDGKWVPLTATQIQFTTSYGSFEGTELVLPEVTTIEKLIIKAVLKSDTSVWKEITVWIKQKPDDELLPTKNEIMNTSPKRGKRGNR